ncbi:FAD-dependent oxidoreductase [Streptomyces coeruleorubidus]|uniref:FAD-dependent oxidoreductase n=1 Tax=Streptomyces coeruleorubidus TaxID=116188 RepID=UPI0036B6A4B2
MIGAGRIGPGTAAAARAAGVEVPVLDTAELPLLRVLSCEVSQIFAALHTDHGVGLYCGVQLAEITGDAGRGSTVRRGCPPSPMQGEGGPPDCVVRENRVSSR